MNRGIYNTVESWLYNRGMDDILKRRNTLLCFLQFAHSKSEFRDSKGHLKFGHGGLQLALNHYWLTFSV
jgi:riboflavin kinase